MELEKYKALLCTIEQGSLSAAAKKLGYTPSGISRMMAALESETGFTLLLRRKEGVLPSYECEQLLPAVREFVFKGEALQQRSAQIRHVEIGTITIGTAYSAYYSWLAKVTSDFHQEHPGIQIKITNGYSSELLKQVNQRTIDLAIISEREEIHQWIPLCEDSVIAMVPLQHPLAKCQSVPVQSFADEPFINTYPALDIDNARIFQKCGVHPNTQFSTMDIYATFSMVEAGLGISMNNEINSKQWAGKIQMLPLNPSQKIEIGIAAAQELSPACTAFLNFARPYLEELK